MAYMNQEKKAVIDSKLKAVMPKGWKYSLSVSNHSTINLTIVSAPVDLIAEINWSKKVFAERRGEEAYTVKGYTDVNHYYLENAFCDSLATFRAIKDAMNTGNHDRSDSQSDYFDVGHYISISIGRAWDKPYINTSAAQ